MKNIPKWITTYKDLIFWHYSKLIAEARGYSRSDYPIVMAIFKDLKSNKILISSLYRENLKLLKNERICAYCGSSDKLEMDHLIPQSKNGPDNVDNIVYACKKCNISKGNKDLLDWYGEDFINKIPHNAFLKYLKLIKEKLEREGLIDTPIRPDFNSSEFSEIFYNVEKFKHFNNNNNQT